jgi:hypothetical protein
VIVQSAGTNVQLIAEDAFGHVGLSAPFDVLAANTPLILRVIRSGNSIQLSWETIAGQSYQVEFKDALDDSLWQPLSGIIEALGPTATASDTLDESEQRFYRVVELP